MRSDRNRRATRMSVCYAVQQVWCSGERILQEVSSLGRLPREERMRGYAGVEIAWHEDPLAVLEEGAVPVAVEFRPHAEPLYDFVHSEQAVYVFGSGDDSLDRSILTRCHRFVVMDTAHCMDLATAVATVLYGRSLKSRKVLRC